MLSRLHKRLVPDAAALGRVRFDAEISVAQGDRARELLGYCEARRDGRFVSRAAIRPRDLVSMLPYLYIAELCPDDAHYRLGGTALVSRMGVEVTGMSVRRIFEQATADRILHSFRSMVVSGQTMSWRGRYYVSGSDSQPAEVVSIPVRCSRRGIHIFGGIFF